MDRYVFLLRLVGKFGDKSEITSRLGVILDSLNKTLRGQLVSLHSTMGQYDFVAIVDIPTGQDLKVMDCLKTLRSPGDVELTILRAFDYKVAYPDLPRS